MIVLVFISFLLIGISTNFQITESSYYYHELRLDRKESQLQRAISYEFLNNDESSINSQSFRDRIFKISDIQNISFSIYDLNGNLIQSTFEENALNKISLELINEVKSSEKNKFVEVKKVGEKQLRESYSLILDSKNEPIWILNFPYVDDDKLNVYELRSFILNIVQVYILLFVLAIIISYFVSSYITNPISEIVYKMKQMRIDKLNKKINLFMDVGPSPEKKFSSEYQAGSLSFEFLSNRKKIFTNAGYYEGTNHQLNELCRSSALQNTLVLDDNSSCKFVYIDKFWLVKKGLKIIKKNTIFEKNYWKINASHDGYKKKYKTIHEREIEFFPEQDYLNLSLRVNTSLPVNLILN